MFLFLIIDTVVIGYDLFNNDAVGRSVADDMIDTGDEKVFLCRHSEQGKIEHKAAVKMRVVVDHGEHLLRRSPRRQEHTQRRVKAQPGRRRAATLIWAAR